jgi:hypothetical protein
MEVEQQVVAAQPLGVPGVQPSVEVEVEVEVQPLVVAVALPLTDLPRHLAALPLAA